MPVVGRCRRVRGIAAVPGRRIDVVQIPSCVLGVVASEVRDLRIALYSTDDNRLKNNGFPWSARETL